MLFTLQLIVDVRICYQLDCDQVISGPQMSNPISRTITVS